MWEQTGTNKDIRGADSRSPFPALWHGRFATSERVCRHIHLAFAFAVFLVAGKAVEICAFVAGHDWFSGFILHHKKK
jgi:hypothetical protein